MTATAARTESHPEQLARLEAQVQALTGQLRHAQRLAALGTVAAMVAHEFNNLLTPILNYATLARQNPSLTEKALAHAADGGARAAEICQAILDISSDSTQRGPTNVREAVDEVLAAMARNPAKDRIELVVDIPGDLAVSARAVEFHQVLLNLLLNARRALMDSPRRRRLEILARTDDDRVVIRVGDNGPGIPREHLERIFEPFFTTQTGEAGQGHGLGLAICREIITSAGGTIDVDSTADQGAAFTITLPR